MAGMIKKTKNKIKKGKTLVCGICGIVLNVDNSCKCREECDVICCGEQMKLKKK